MPIATPAVPDRDAPAGADQGVSGRLLPALPALTLTLTHAPPTTQSSSTSETIRGTASPGWSSWRTRGCSRRRT